MKSIFKQKEQTVAEIEEEVTILQRQQSVRFSILMVTYFVLSTFLLGRTLELLFSDIAFSHFFDTLRWYKVIISIAWWTGLEIVYRNWRKKRLAKQQIRLREMQAASA